MMKGKIRLILENHWDDFLKIYGKKIRKNVIKEVDKVLRCGDIKNVYLEMKCDKGNTIKKIGFTCKSRFCTSCGKIYVDNWVDNMIGNLFNVRHRHIVFTIPEGLRTFFGKDRGRLKILPRCKSYNELMHSLGKRRNLLQV